MDGRSLVLTFRIDGCFEGVTVDSEINPVQVMRTKQIEIITKRRPSQSCLMDFVTFKAWMIILIEE